MQFNCCFYPNPFVPPLPSDPETRVGCGRTHEWSTVLTPTTDQVADNFYLHTEAPLF